MPKHLRIAFPHDLGAAEVRRRLDMQTEWALRRLERENIRIAVTDWSENGRTFTATALGQSVSGGLSVAEDTLCVEATMPWTLGVFSPAIEAAARTYAARLLAAEAPT